MKFKELGLKEEFLEKISQQKFVEPTLIQEKGIPLIRQGKDVIGLSQTGSGKTIAFALPLLEKVVIGKGIQAIVLTPTRELAEQVNETMSLFGRSIGVKSTSIYGGVSLGPQITLAQKSEVIVATPGRLIDHLDRKNFDLNNVFFVVLDEMDRMLDIGFEKDVRIILEQIRNKRQTIMFSATLPEKAKVIAKKYLNNPIQIHGEQKIDTSLLKQVAFFVSKEKRFSLLVHLLKEQKGISIVFCRTKRDVDKVAKNLNKNGLSAEGIHSDVPQNKRLQIIRRVKNNELDALIATDVASRGLDIKNITHVYNYEIPSESDDYTHRIGRTARAGKNGIAITFVTEHDKQIFFEISKTNKIESKSLPEFQQIVFVKTEPKNKSNQNEWKKGFEKQETSQNKYNQGQRNKYNQKKDYLNQKKDYLNQKKDYHQQKKEFSQRGSQNQRKEGQNQQKDYQNQRNDNKTNKLIHNKDFGENERKGRKSFYENKKLSKIRKKQRFGQQQKFRPSKRF